MREMNEDEKKVFGEKMDYISKLKDSMDQEEMDGLLPKSLQEKMDMPRFSFSGCSLYPRKDFNDYLEASFTGSPMAERVKGLEDSVGRLEEEKRNLIRETDQYVAEIERLEGELKEAKASRYTQPESSTDDSPIPMLTGSKKGFQFYKGEFAVVIFSALSNWMENHRPQMPSSNVRSWQCAKVARDELATLCDMRAYDTEAKRFRESLERAIDECFSTTPTSIRPLIALGFKDLTRKNSAHWKFSWQGHDDYTFTMSKTPSDARAPEKSKSEIISRLCI